MHYQKSFLLYILVVTKELDMFFYVQTSCMYALPKIIIIFKAKILFNFHNFLIPSVCSALHQEIQDKVGCSIFKNNFLYPNDFSFLHDNKLEQKHAPNMLLFRRSRNIFIS
jgi:hypothetical protein